MSCCQGKNMGCKKVPSQEAVSDYLVCTCLGVMHSEIKEAIQNGSKTFEELSESLGVGTGCSSCVAEVNAILKESASTGCCKS